MRIFEIIFEHKNTVVFKKLSGFLIGSRLSNSCGCNDGCGIRKFSIVYSRNMGYGSASCFENSAAGAMEDMLVFWYCSSKYFSNNDIWVFRDFSNNFWLDDFWFRDLSNNFGLGDLSNNFRFDNNRLSNLNILAGPFVVLESSSRFANLAALAGMY